MDEIMNMTCIIEDEFNENYNEFKSFLRRWREFVL